MRNNKLFIFIVAYFVCIFQLQAQRIVQFSSNEPIANVISDNGYIGITTYAHDRNTGATTSAICLDPDGGRIFEYTLPEIDVIKNAIPDFTKNKLIIIGTKKGESTGFVKVFELNSGLMRFEQLLNNTSSNSYVLSPDKKYLMTGDYGDPDGGSEFAIINLETGEKTSIENIRFPFPAAWYDKERIIFLSEKWVDNPAYLEYQAARQAERQKIIQLQTEQSYLLRDKETGRINQEEFVRRSAELEAAIEETRLIIHPKPKVINPAGKTMVDKYGLMQDKSPSTKLPDGKFINLYNILTHTLEQEQRILTVDGSDFYGLQASPIITTDKKQNIYISDLLLRNPDPSKYHLYYFVKLNPDLTTVWQIKGNPRKVIYYQGEKYFIFDKQILDNETGQLLAVDEAAVKIFTDVDETTIQNAINSKFHFETLSGSFTVDRQSNTLILK
jgi:hypothetical protein